MLHRSDNVLTPYDSRTILVLFGVVALVLLPILALRYWTQRRKLRALLQAEIDRQSAAIREADDAA